MNNKTIKTTVKRRGVGIYDVTWDSNSFKNGEILIKVVDGKKVSCDINNKSKNSTTLKQFIKRIR